MRFHQVKELVSWAAEYHARIAELYADAASGDVDDRVRLALEYLATRERKLQGDLQGYLEDGSDHGDVLDCWFDDPTNFPHPSVLESLPEQMDKASVQDVLATALATHKTLQNLYAYRAERATGSAERDFFRALTSGHEAEVRRIARDIQRLEDY